MERGNSNNTSRKRINFNTNEEKKETKCQGTQTDSRITRQSFTQEEMSENLFLLLKRQVEDSRLMHDIMLERRRMHVRNESHSICKIIDCEKVSRGNLLKYCKRHWNETFICNITMCNLKRFNDKHYCLHHVDQMEVFKGKNFCNVENCRNIQRRRGVCEKHF